MHRTLTPSTVSSLPVARMGITRTSFDNLEHDQPNAFAYSLCINI